MTEWFWPNHDNDKPDKLNLTEIDTDKPNLNFTSGVLLISVPDVFFLVEERSEAGQVSQPVRACEPGLGDLSKPTAPAYFFVVKVMLVGVVNFGQTQNEGLSVWKIFGHVQTNFWSSLFGQVN